MHYLRGMIAFGTAVASETTYRARALPGIRRVAEPDSLLLAPRGQDSLQAAYNRILDEAGPYRELEALVLLHEDVEIVDREFMARLRRRIAEVDVAVVGVVGALGVRSLAWWKRSASAGWPRRRSPAPGASSVRAGPRRTSTSSTAFSWHFPRGRCASFDSMRRSLGTSTATTWTSAFRLGLWADGWSSMSWPLFTMPPGPEDWESSGSDQPWH